MQRRIVWYVSANVPAFCLQIQAISYPDDGGKKLPETLIPVCQTTRYHISEDLLYCTFHLTWRIPPSP